MLVVVSDLHLTDHPTGNPELEQRLIDFLEEIRIRNSALGVHPNVDVLLLGDIFDFLNSVQWAQTDLRPWQPHSPKHGELVERILEGILAQFKKLVGRMSDLIKGEAGIRFEYVIGNHDFLLNCQYAKDARKKLRTAFGLPGQTDAHFDEHTSRPEYRLVALHGHEFDPWNYRRGDLWPFGDAVVIELFRGFLRAAADRLGLAADDPILLQLNEIYHVRPESLAPFWTRALTTRFRMDAAQRKALAKAWADAIETMFRVDYIRENLKRYRKLPQFRRREIVLRGSAHFDPSWLPTTLKRRHVKEADPIRYERRARLPLALDASSRFVVAGHTHRPGVFHLELLKETREPLIYVNTGTWQQVHLPVLFENQGLLDFSSEFVSAHAVFYTQEEQQKTRKRYELHQLRSSWGP